MEFRLLPRVQLFSLKDTLYVKFTSILPEVIKLNCVLNFHFFQSPVNADTGSAHDETSSSGNKEDEDDDDDESDDKIDTQTHDPERLKAFNVSY